MLSISSVLSLFLLLILSSVVYFVAKKIKAPYTVLLVLVGLLLVPLVQLPMLNPILGFLTDLVLTPEMLFYVFLPILIFESAFNMNIRKMVENIWSISLLAVFGLLISSLLIATALYFVLPLVGLPIPFVVALLFGSIISSTDPVAVLALFKEFGAPKRLTMIFEGESLFNDGTAVALFLIVLSVAETSFKGFGTLTEGLGMFLMMVILGCVFGIIMATIFSKGLRYAKSNEFVLITLLIVSAHLVFILCELINANAIFGVHLHISSIIATTVSSLFLGNYTRHSLSPKSEEYINKSIEHLAFVANSLVFLLAGILFASTNIDFSRLLVPIIVTILIVASSRIISVYSVTKPLNLLKIESIIPESWQLLLAWGSLRGALAIIVVLLVPDDLVIAGWEHGFSVKELLIALTIGCILATLFIKALTIGPLIKKLRISEATPFRKAYRIDFGLYCLLAENDGLKQQQIRGFITDKQCKNISNLIVEKVKRIKLDRSNLMSKHGSILFEQTLRYAAVNIEAHYLKELYSNNEIEESVYRKINGKLNLQKEKIENGVFEEIDSSNYIDQKDIFDNLVIFVQSIFNKKTTNETVQQKYQYYRAQSIISRKVLKTFAKMQEQYDSPVFDSKIYDSVMAIYNTYRKTNEDRMKLIYQNNKSQTVRYINELSMKSLHSLENKSFEFLADKGLADETIINDIERLYSI